MTDGYDLAVLALGVNDVLRLHGPRRWSRDLRVLLRALRERTGAGVVLAPVPPMHGFPVLPQPLRAVLGARADRLDHAAARLADGLPGVAHAALPRDALHEPDLFCSDGFHPSAAGYARWAEGMVPALVSLLP